nr:putative Ig domain-containing protein [uncultured Desulfobacter sp.]
MKKNGWLAQATALAVLLITGMVVPLSAMAADSICATVKIQIVQELTLERQAFDANMKITNGLTNISLEDVQIDVTFADEEGNSVLASSDSTNTDALFFIRIDSMDGIDDVEGDGVVEPESTADIHWLIIPAQGASNGLESGTLYYVGATLTYTINGTEHVTEVSPDYIYVKPLPDLTLDYFLPNDVYGDDPFTDEIEEEIPFSLGVRVSNNGEGTAYSLKIESAQPKIVENELGLLIDFSITGSEVNGEAATSSLLVDFGDIAPNDAGTARWSMVCSLYGQFTEFTAEFTHSDELGGEMTSLISAVNTHFLVHDVLVDLPGRDTIKDFLSLDGIAYTVYESDNVDTAVTNQSSSATLVKTGTSGTQATYTLTVPATTGPMVVKLDDPFSDAKVILSATRSDGKSISEDNVWLYKTKEKDNPWDCYFYLFDVNTPGTYTIVFEDPSVLPQAPVLQYIPDRQRVEEQQLSFIVEASDPNGTIPSLSTSSLPVGATFVDNGDGTGLFDWTPMSGQAGTYTIKFTASDGALSASRTATQTICSLDDTDCDGMNDEWELEHFGTLDRDGTGDYDGDGISDLDEYLNGTDPDGTENAPTVPVIYAPQTGDTVTEYQPELSVECSTDADDDTLTYEFELFSDAGYTTLVASENDVEESGAIVPWTVPVTLTENQTYYWRVRAFDGTAYSLWTHGRFLVSQTNEAPGGFELLTPRDADAVDTLTPILVSGFSTDPENDALTYTFAVYADQALTDQIATGQGTPDEESGMVFWQISETLTNQNTYYWQVTAEDSNGSSVVSQVFSFTVQTENQTPDKPEIHSPESGSEVNTATVTLSIGAVSDPDGDEVIYDFQIDVSKAFSSDTLLNASSGEISVSQDTVQWQVADLNENTWYYWRARSRDSESVSQWVYGRFFVNTYNDVPATPVIKNPGDLAWVNTLTPALTVHQVEEPDNDAVEMMVEIYTDEDLTDLVVEESSGTLSLTISQELKNATWYFWRAKLVDSHGIEGEWSVIQSFFVKEDATNAPPTITLTTPETDTIITVEGSSKVFTLSWDDADPDSDARISLYYDTDDSGEDGTLIISGISEDSDEVNDSYEWNVSGIAGGTYYLYALISDGTSTVADYAPGSIHINYPPQAPSSPEPADGKTDLSVMDLSLSWTGGDPDEDDTITYDIQYKAEGGEFTLACEDILDTECQLSTLLNYGTTYLWQVLATDSFGAITQGPEWQFTTFTADADADNDDLSNENEITAGTDPFDKDTDKDSYTDGEEFYAGTDPSDAASSPPYPPKYGDLDGDLDIDGADLIRLMSMLHLTSADTGFDSDADFNNDGVIDELDLELFAKIFGYRFTESCSDVDLDGDNDVDGRDIQIFGQLIGVEYESGDANYELYQRADFNKDNKINYLDFPYFVVHLGCKAQ